MSGRGEWSSRSLGSRFKHEVFYWLIKLGGAGAARPLLYLVVLYYSLRPEVRRRSRPYLRRRFPGDGRWAAFKRAFKLNLSFGLVLLDRAVMGLSGRMEFLDPAGGAARVRELLAEGRGLIVLTAHVGAWQTGLGWLGQAGTGVHIVQRRQADDVDRHYFEHGSGGPGPKIIDSGEPAAALAAMASALLAGETVCLMGDRLAGREALSLKVPFLGGEIRLPGAPFHLAARLGAPIAVVFTRRLGPSKVAGEIVRVIRVEPAAGSRRPKADLSRPASSFADCLEKYVEENPYQFFNFYDLWSN